MFSASKTHFSDDFSLEKYTFDDFNLEKRTFPMISASKKHTFPRFSAFKNTLFRSVGCRRIRMIQNYELNLFVGNGESAL